MQCLSFSVPVWISTLEHPHLQTYKPSWVSQGTSEQVRASGFSALCPRHQRPGSLHRGTQREKEKGAEHHGNSYISFPHTQHWQSSNACLSSFFSLSTGSMAPHPNGSLYILVLYLLWAPGEQTACFVMLCTLAICPNSHLSSSPIYQVLLPESCTSALYLLKHRHMHFTTGLASLTSVFPESQ